MSEPYLIPHGTTRRAKTCGCMACTAAKSGQKFDGEFAWPLKPLLWAMGRGSLNELRKVCGKETVERWQEVGLNEADADETAIRVAKLHPMHIWRGWIDRGNEPLEAGAMGKKSSPPREGVQADGDTSS